MFQESLFGKGFVDDWKLNKAYLSTYIIEFLFIFTMNIDTSNELLFEVLCGWSYWMPFARNFDIFSFSVWFCFSSRPAPVRLMLSMYSVRRQFFGHSVFFMQLPLDFVNIRPRSDSHRGCSVHFDSGFGFEGSVLFLALESNERFIQVVKRFLMCPRWFTFFTAHGTQAICISRATYVCLTTQVLCAICGDWYKHSDLRIHYFYSRFWYWTQQNLLDFLHLIEISTAPKI